MDSMPFGTHLVPPDTDAVWVSLDIAAHEEAFQGICDALDLMYTGWGIPIPLRTWGVYVQRFVIQLPRALRWEHDEPQAFQAMLEDETIITFAVLDHDEKALLRGSERPFLKLLPASAVSDGVGDALRGLDGVLFTPLAMRSAPQDVRAWELVALRDSAGRAPCVAEITHRGMSQGVVPQLLQRYMGWSQEKIATAFSPCGHLTQVVFPSADRVFLSAECANAEDNCWALVR